jgi:hypothetical protein
MIETAHHQQFFSQHLPKLTDVATQNKNGFVHRFIEDMVFKVLG